MGYNRDWVAHPAQVSGCLFSVSAVRDHFGFQPSWCQAVGLEHSVMFSPEDDQNRMSTHF